MGTNYYLERELCDKCHNSEREHIGKASVGWTFSFQATDAIRSYRDWLAEFEKGGRIVNEYGEEISVRAFQKMVEAKTQPWRDGSPPKNHAAEFMHRGDSYAQTQFLDPEGHSFSEGDFS